MKILFLAPHLSTGGMPAFLLKRIDSLKKYVNDIELYVIEHSFYGDAYVVQRNAIKDLLANNFYSVGYEDKISISHIIDEIKPDIIHIDEMAEMLDRRLINFIYNNDRTWKVIETCHNISFNPSDKVFYPDLYAFCTPYHENTFSILNPNFVTIQYPIDKLSVFKSIWMDHLGFDKTKKHVLNVGLWTPGKNQKEGLEIARKYPDLMFHFVGNQADNFKDYWEPLMIGLPENVKVWGERSDIEKFMMASDIFMFNSTWECNPLVIREAIQYGLPIIAHNLPQYVGMYDNYIQPMNSDLNNISANYDIPVDNTSIKFALNHKDMYEKVLNTPMQEQKVSVIQHFVDNPYLEIKGISDAKKIDNCISIVLAHPNNEFRSNLLKNCLKKIKTPIILSANYPVEKEAQLLCDHYIYTKENPLLLKEEFEKYNVSFFHWHIKENGEKEYTLFEKEHGYSVYCLIKNGVEYAKRLGYKFVNVINYDYEISESTIYNNYKNLEKHDFVVYKYNSTSYDTNSYCSAFFSAKTDAVLSFVRRFQDKKDYYTNGPSFNILEIKLYDFINQNNYNAKEYLIEDLKKNNKVDIEGIDYTNQIEKDRKINDNRFLVEFYDDHNKCVYSNTINVNNWIKLNRKWFTKWKTKVWDNGDLIYENELNYNNRRVLITIESRSLGDTLAWIPYALEFKKKHKCHVIVSSFWNKILDYPELELVEPGSVVENLYGLYRVGWFYDQNKEPQPPNTITMQKTATNILGLKYKEIKPHLKKPDIEKDANLICIAIHSTAQAKYWNNPTGWQELVEWLKSQGYRVKLLSKEGMEFMGNMAPEGLEWHQKGEIEGVIEELLKCKMFIGIGSGLSWLSWSLGVSTVIISGFSEKWAEMENCIRIEAPLDKCTGCFNRHRLDAGDWNWCPDHKGTERQFECTKSITSEMVIEKIKDLL